MKTTEIAFPWYPMTLLYVIICGCSSQGVVGLPDNSNCSRNLSAHCILERAEIALQRIDNDRDWVAGGLEFAAALHASQQIEMSQHYLDEAAMRASNIQDLVERATAFAQVAKVYSELYTVEATRKIIDLGEAQLGAIDAAHKRQDLLGQFLSARAAIGAADSVVALALDMSQSDATLASYKARTLHEIAPLQAKSGSFDTASKTLERIEMGLPYYQATSRADVAKIAAADGRGEFARRQLAKAVSISRAQTDGYFVAGALRHVGETWASMNDEVTALEYFAEAAAGARTADAQQQKARALSRVATGMADHGFHDRASNLVSEAVSIAMTEETDMLRYWSYYEITGSAAFAGNFAVALELLEKIPVDTKLSGVLLRGVTQRDIAWGLARHKELARAIALTEEIESARERVQALSRIVRVMQDPAMNALPRYL